MLGMKVLVLAAPCLHLGYLGCYGADWVRTPHLDRLAAEGIVFDQHYADVLAPRTQFHGPLDPGPNLAWWTGRYEAFDTADQAKAGAEGTSQLFPWLEAQGIATLRIVAQSRMAVTATPPSLRFPRNRLLDGLVRVAHQDRLLVWVDLPSLAPPWPEFADRHLRAYFPKERAEDQEPLLPWLDPPHGEIDSAEGARERLQATYAAVVTYFDAQVGRLLQELHARDAYDPLLVIFTADRGLALGEHGVVGDASTGLHEELIHVPLLVRLPGGAEAGRRVAALTQPVDLYPTLVEALGLPQPEGHGRSLLALARGQVDAIRSYACARRTVGGRIEYALRTPDWSFLLTQSAAAEAAPCLPQLYVKPDDRWEVNNVLQHHLELAQRLEQTLGEFWARARRPGPFQPPELPEENHESTKVRKHEKKTQK
jgi:arylsulfatase A-like enzyme